MVSGAMGMGELMTRGTIWVALLAYFAAAAGLLLGKRDGWVRWAWTMGFLTYLLHVGCAFHFYHDWSHDRAYEDTARQTEALFGWHWGGGLYVNYLFTLAWGTDVIGWWCGGGKRVVNRWVERLWQGFFFFMVVNGTVVFGTGWGRWTGVLGCALLAVLWWRRRCGGALRGG